MNTIKCIFLFILINVFFACEADDITEQKNEIFTKKPCQLHNHDTADNMNDCIYAHGDQVDDHAGPE